MIRRTSIFTSISFAAFGAATFLFSMSASANSFGQFDYSGRAASCLNCHGANQYAGVAVAVSGANEVSCWSTDTPDADDPTFTETLIPQLDFATGANLTVTIPAPSGTEGPQCPSTDCCNGETDPNVQCGQENIDVDGTVRPGPACLPFFADCPTSYAGLNVEVENGGEFAIADDDTSLKYAPNDDRSQISHTQSHDFVNGEASWTFGVVAPSEENYSGPLDVWVGANVANGNGYADNLDLNTNYKVAIAVGDNLPGYCLVCDDEGTLPDENGQCGGCGCSAEQTSDEPIALGAFGAAFGLFLLRRRRRSVR